MDFAPTFLAIFFLLCLSSIFLILYLYFYSTNLTPHYHINIDSFSYSNVSQFFPLFLMATIRSYGSFVPFTLPLQDHGRVTVSEDLLSLRFNLQIGTMYVEQEMYSVDGEVSETILLQKNRCDDGQYWILGPGSFRVIGLSDSQVQASTIVLTNNSCTSTVQLPLVANVKVEPSDDTILLLSDSDGDVCPVVDLFDTSHFPFRTRTPTPPLHSADVHNTPRSPLYMKLPHHGSPSSRPPVHPSSSSLCINIVDCFEIDKGKEKV